MICGMLCNDILVWPVLGGCDLGSSVSVGLDSGGLARNDEVDVNTAGEQFWECDMGFWKLLSRYI